MNAIGPFTEYEVVRFENISGDYVPDNATDALVISGSGYRSVHQKDREKFAAVTSLIKRFDRPILGVCFAIQLIGHAFGAGLGTLEEPVYDKFEQVRIVDTDEIFEGYKPGDHITLVEYHNDYVVEQGLSQSGFKLLADSQSCEVEAIKLNSKPIYGVQFHPERYRIKGEEHKEGLTIFENFYKRVAKR